MQIDGKEVALPVGVMRMMIAAVARLAEGKAVAMMPVEDEVSPQDAAEILKVSRPYAAKLFDEGAIPSRRSPTSRSKPTRRWSRQWAPTPAFPRANFRRRPTTT